MRPRRHRHQQSATVALAEVVQQVQAAMQKPNPGGRYRTALDDRPRKA